MNLNKIYNFNKMDRISDIYTLSGNCGVFDGCINESKETETGFVSVQKDFTVNSVIEETEKVFMRTDTIKNTSEETLHIYNYAYRFCIDGGDIDVYTQLNHWQNESNGQWQKLVTEVSVASRGMHTTADASPVLAIWNNQTNRGIVFHIMPRHGWKISAIKRTFTKRIYTIIEISVADNALELPVEKGGEIELSPVIYYEFTDKNTLDCYKLHKYINKLYPRKEMPVMYNTWLAFFDKVSFENVQGQIKEAADLGCEYFVLDAGWFGEGENGWGDAIGQWSENHTGAYKGRMKELSEEVNKNGMKFGLWLEPERALKGIANVQEHHEFFYNNNENAAMLFLDFANDEARAYITKVTTELIDKYNIEYIKFDFNGSLAYDRDRKAFYDYHKGHVQYIKAIREKYPHIYLECCASGGYRMDLENLRYFDSFWFSDNQSPYDGLEIIKNTILRMTPSAIDRWGVLVNMDGFVPISGTDITMRTLAIDNGTWDAVINVSPEYMCGFFSGGAPAFSCDLTKIDSSVKDQFKEFIDQYKKERDFWINAACRILCDSEDVIALQYENGGKIKIVIYTRKMKQESFTVFPAIENKDYIVDGKLRTFDDIQTNGIVITLPESFYSYTISLTGGEKE